MTEMTLQDLADAVVHEAEMRRAVRRLLQPDGRSDR